MAIHEKEADKLKTTDLYTGRYKHINSHTSRQIENRFIGTLNHTKPNIDPWLERPLNK